MNVVIRELVGGIKKHMEGNDNHHIAQTRSLIFVCIAHVFCAWFESFVSYYVSSPVFGQLCLVCFFISHKELEKLRDTSNQDLAINPIFKCDECSYMAISWTILKRRTTVTNKDEPKAKRQLLLVFAFHVQNWKSEDTPFIRSL